MDSEHFFMGLQVEDCIMSVLPCIVRGESRKRRWPSKIRCAVFNEVITDRSDKKIDFVKLKC